MGQPLVDIRTYMLSVSGLVETGWLLYLARLPDEPDQVIVISETPFTGPGPDAYGSANAQLQFQLRVRASQLEYEICREKWQECWNALHNVSFTVGGRSYIYLMAAGDVPMVFYDSQQRVNMTVDFRVMARR